LLFFLLSGSRPLLALIPVPDTELAVPTKSALALMAGAWAASTEVIALIGKFSPFWVPNAPQKVLLPCFLSSSPRSFDFVSD